MKLTSPLCAGLVALAIAVGLGACGGGSGGERGEGQQGSQSGGATAPAGTPTTKDEVIARCRQAASKLTGDSRKTAEASCEAGETGNTTAVRDAARQQCLNMVKDIADPAARKQAQGACNRDTE